MLENKDDSIVDLLDTMLTKWEEGEGAGARVDRFLLYYRGHGVQVSGQPCLLTPDWDTIPILGNSFFSLIDIMVIYYGGSIIMVDT